MRDKMIKIDFNKNLELIFGLMYSVNRDYGLEPQKLYVDTIPSYCNEFYELYRENIDGELIDYIRKGGLDTFNRSAEIALSIDENYDIVEDEYIKKIEQSNPNFNKEKLEGLLKEFVKKSKYDEFYLNHRQFYDSLIKKYREVLNKYTKFDESLITDFYGYKIGNMKIILYNFTQISFGYHNGEDVINVRCVQNIGKDENDIEFSSKDIIKCFHEFSHPYMNSLGEKYFKDVDLSNLYEDAKKHGLQFLYKDILTVINEYMVRAVQIYLGKKYVEEEFMKRHVEYNKSIGYKYVLEVAKLFDKKDNYSSFEEFYRNEVVEFFKKLNGDLPCT